MTEELEQILSQLTQPDNAIIQQATAQLKQAFKDPAIIPGLCAVMSGSQNPQIRQSAAVMLRLRVKKHWKKISPNDRERFEHTVQHSLSQLCAVMVKHETPDHWPALLQLLTHTSYNEAMEVFNELMESEVSIIVPHVADIVRFFLEVGSDTNLSDSLRVKALSCVTFLIKLKSKTVLKQKLLNPILQAIFPVLTAAPAPGEQDPEDEEDNSGDGTDNESPKHCAAQIIDTMALHMPPEKLFQQLMPLTQTCLASENPYQRKGGLMCLAVLAEGCADHIRTKMLKSVLQTVCQSLSDSSEVVRSAGLFALGQFSEHLQPEVSTYCSELMPLLLGYLSSLNQAKIGHVTKAFYALENFMENLGKLEKISPETITFFSSSLILELLVPYFTPVIESLKGFLTTTTEEMRSLQTQSLDTLSVLARTIGKDVFSPLAAECVQLGLNLTDTIDDPDLRRCTYSLYSAVSIVSPDCLTPHLTAITTVMLYALKSSEGVTAHLEEDKTFVLLDDDDDDNEEKDTEDFLEDDKETDIHDVYDAMLQEFAGEGIPLVAASVPADNFFPFLNDLLPFIMNKAKSSCTVADRSFSVGTIAEILHALMSVSGAKDSDPEVRNNSVFGLGCLAQAAGPIVVSDYPMMLSVFSNLLSKESDLRVIDNLCAALCRMIMSNVDAVPLEQVLPALVARLPLKEDQEENNTVFSCLAMLYTHSPALVQSKAHLHLFIFEDEFRSLWSKLVINCRNWMLHSKVCFLKFMLC
uniref:Importin 4 n=1 Tax=Oreochromis niloticus TaxID=8128 RepID=A0A669BY86_ORENI